MWCISMLLTINSLWVSNVCQDALSSRFENALLNKFEMFFSVSEAFATFPLLQDLELTLNSIVDVSFKQGEFTKLQV